jgi:hypothetical protein
MPRTTRWSAQVLSTRRMNILILLGYASAKASFNCCTTHTPRWVSGNVVVQNLPPRSPHDDGRECIPARTALAGPGRRQRRYLATARSETLKPSNSSSLWIFGAPQSAFSNFIVESDFESSDADSRATAKETANPEKCSIISITNQLLHGATVPSEPGTIFGNFTIRNRAAVPAAPSCFRRSPRSARFAARQRWRRC